MFVDFSGAVLQSKGILQEVDLTRRLKHTTADVPSLAQKMNNGALSETEKQRGSESKAVAADTNRSLPLENTLKIAESSARAARPSQYPEPRAQGGQFQSKEIYFPIQSKDLAVRKDSGLGNLNQR
jgi:hypothetical protein